VENDIGLPGLDDLGPGSNVPETVTLGAATPQEQPKPDPFEAVHELGKQLGSRIDQLAGIVERVATTRSAGEPAPGPAARGGEPVGLGGATPLAAEIQAAMARGEIKSQADLAKFVNDKALASPNGIGEVMVGILGMAETIATEKARAANVPLQETHATDMLDRFRRDNLADPYFLAAREEFDALAERARSQGAWKGMNPAQIQDGLLTLKKIAIGEVVMRKAGGNIPDNVTALNRQREVPNYRIGSGGGASGSVGGAGGGTRVDMTPREPVEKQLIESGAAYGMSKEEIAESLQDLRNDPTQGFGAPA
jgi:hypothetical protein